MFFGFFGGDVGFCVVGVFVFFFKCFWWCDVVCFVDWPFGGSFLGWRGCHKWAKDPSLCIDQLLPLLLREVHHAT